MLDRKKWWDVVETTVMRRQLHQETTPFEKQALLDEQYRTQIVMQGFNSGEVGKIYTPQVISERNDICVTSIIGMPNAGKTLTSETIVETRTMEVPLLMQEVYREEKEDLDKSKEFSFIKLYERLLNRQTTEFKKAIELGRLSVESGLNTEGHIMFDRLVWTDLPMARAHFLIGNINHPTLELIEKEFVAHLIHGNDTNNILINCIIKPELAISRQSTGEGLGRILNPIFLPILYEQSLRFHYEMVNFEKVFKIRRPFTYATVDMSSPDRIIRFRSLEKVINWSLIAQNNIFTIESINDFIK